MTPQEAISVIGPADESTIAEIIATGATVAELFKAWTWANADESLICAGLPLPTGTVAELIDLLTPGEPAASEFNVSHDRPSRISGWPAVY